MAVRTDWPELASLIDKGLAAMPLDERNAISAKWGNLQGVAPVDYTLVWQVAGAATLILLACLYWNRRLAREIAQRQASLTVRPQPAGSLTGPAGHHQCARARSPTSTKPRCTPPACLASN